MTNSLSNIISKQTFASQAKHPPGGKASRTDSPSCTKHDEDTERCGNGHTKAVRRRRLGDLLHGFLLSERDLLNKRQTWKLLIQVGVTLLFDPVRIRLRAMLAPDAIDH